MSISFHFRDNGFTHVCGHRGFSLHYPENTITAFDATRDAGGTTCETDLVLSRDGEVIVLHDMTLDRTTNGHGFAADHDWAQIQKLDASAKTGSHFAGVRIPSFRETVLWAKENKIGLDAELKDDDRPDMLAERVIDILRETDGFGHVRIISFDHKALKAIRSKDERLRTQAILHARHVDPVHVLHACGAESASIEMMMFDAEDAEIMHKAGLCNRVHLPRPQKLVPGWAYGRDILPDLRAWIRDGLIDIISGDDVLFLRRLVDSAKSGA